MSALYLTVETAANTPPDKAIAQLTALADRLQIMVQTRLNGVAVFAAPGDSPLRILRKFEEVSNQGRKIAMVRSGR
jgi:hypothetical protein